MFRVCTSSFVVVTLQLHRPISRDRKRSKLVNNDNMVVTISARDGTVSEYGKKDGYIKCFREHGLETAAMCGRTLLTKINHKYLFFFSFFTFLNSLH